MTSTKIAISVLAALLLVPAVMQPSAAADRDHRRSYERERHESWRGDIHRFHEHDLRIWRRGHWYQGRHAGRRGWWWIVEGVWYFYPVPVYPYPDPYQPPVAVVPSAPPAPQLWYYCANPPGYYPYVPQCGTDWQRVPANPSPPGSVPPPGR